VEEVSALEPTDPMYALKFMEVVSPVLLPRTEVKGPSNLYEAYLDGRPGVLASDVSQRPDHYTPRQQAIVANLQHNLPLHPPATDQEMDELILTWQQNSQTTKQRKELVQKITASRHAPKDIADEAVLEDSLQGKSPTEKEQILNAQDPLAGGGFIKII